MGELVLPLESLSAEAVDENQGALGVVGGDIDHRQAARRFGGNAHLPAEEFQVNFHVNSLLYSGGGVNEIEAISFQRSAFSVPITSGNLLGAGLLRQRIPNAQITHVTLL